MKTFLTISAIIFLLFPKSSLGQTDQKYFGDKNFVNFYQKDNASYFKISKGSFMNTISLNYFRIGDYGYGSTKHYKQINDTVYQLVRENQYDMHNVLHFLIKKNSNTYFMIEMDSVVPTKYFRHFEFNSDKKEAKKIDTAAIRKEAIEKLKVINLIVRNEAQKRKEKIRDFMNTLTSQQADPKLMNEIKLYSEKYAKDAWNKSLTTKKVLLGNEDFVIVKDEKGRPINKQLFATIFLENKKEGKCYVYYGYFGYKYQGNAYSNTLVWFPSDSHDHFWIGTKSEGDIFPLYIYPYELNEMGCNQ